MKLIIDFDRIDEEKLMKCLKNLLGVEGSLEEVLRKLSESFDLYVTELPIPKNSEILKKMKGFRINPSKVCDDRLISTLIKFCKPVESFTADEIYECDGVRLILSRDNLEDVYVLETNVDDVSGEVIAYALNEILKDALDAYIYPYYGKKGRPGYMIKVLCKEKVYDLARKVCEILPTLGVRMYRVKRYKVERRVVEKTVVVFGKKFNLRIKVSEVSVKPEFDDVKKIAEELKKPLPVVYLEILRGLRDEDTNGE